jgi:roadblock/LC7 domain-containing protein
VTAVIAGSEKMRCKRFNIKICLPLVGLFLFISLCGCKNVLSDVEANTWKDITSFYFAKENNATLTIADAAGIIIGTDIAVVVPGGTDVNALVATFVTTGASVTVDGKPQV